MAGKQGRGQGRKVNSERQALYTLLGQAPLLLRFSERVSYWCLNELSVYLCLLHATVGAPRPDTGPHSSGYPGSSTVPGTCKPP